MIKFWIKHLYHECTHQYTHLLLVPLLHMYMTSRYNYNIHALFISGKTAHAAVGRIALTMCLAAASGGITQCIVSGLVQIYNRHEQYNTNEIANAVLANLVAVTGCCPFIEPSWAILIGRKTCCYCSTLRIYMYIHVFK